MNRVIASLIVAVVITTGILAYPWTIQADGRGNIVSSQFFTSQSSQIVATIASGQCVVYVGTVSDSDPVHRGIDANPTVGGVSMSAVTQSTVSGQNNQVDIFYLKNASGGSVGSSISISNPYHASSPGFQGAIYVISGCDTVTQPTTSGHAESTGAANPSITLTSVGSADLIIEGVAGGNTLTATGGQTVDVTSTGNGSTFDIASKSAISGSNTESYTMSSAAYAFSAIAIKIPATVLTSSHEQVTIQKAVVTERGIITRP